MLGILPAHDRAAVADYLKSLGITAEPIKKFAAADIIAATKGDKKVRAKSPHYVLLEKIGDVYKKDGQFAHAVEDAVVQKALENLKDRP